MKGKPIMISDAGVGSHWIWLKAKFGFTEMTHDVLRHAIAQMNRHRLATAGDAETAGIGVMT